MTCNYREVKECFVSEGSCSSHACGIDHHLCDKHEKVCRFVVVCGRHYQVCCSDHSMKFNNDTED